MPFAHHSPRGSMLRLYQAESFLSLFQAACTVRGATFTLLYPRQAGKNEVSAAFVAALLAANMVRGGTVVVCAPSFTPQAEISVARVRRALAVIGRIFPNVARPRLAGNTISVGEASAIFLSASPEAHVAGHTASLALVADEAQEIDADWFDRQFRPMAASTAAPVLLAGTPWNGETLLDRAVAANRLRDASGVPGAPRFHYEVTWEEVALSSPAYGLHVQAERDRLGAAHPLFLTQYALETVAAAGRLLTADDLGRLEGSHARLREPLPGERYVGGLDFGGDGRGADATILTIGRVADGACEVVEHLAWNGAEYARMQDEVAAAVAAWRLERLCADGTGIGSALAAELANHFGDRVERLAFTAPSKSELGYALLAGVRSGRLHTYGPDGSAEARALRAELRACAVKLQGPARMQWGAPPGAHDDYVVSLALCLRAANALPRPRIAMGRPR
ncbi:MAG: hypothetical protein ACKVT1_00060 [Dehalococcoidia bacterium]